MTLDSNVTLGPSGFSPGSGALALLIYQDAGATDPTSILFDRVGTDLIYRTMNVDEGSDWYFCVIGDEFSAATISTHNFTPFNQSGQSYAVGYGEFYMGMNTGRGFVGPGEPRRDVFGWARMSNSPSGIVLVGSGVTYDSPGVYIGTTSTVPEPATLLLGLFGLAVIGARKVFTK